MENYNTSEKQLLNEALRAFEVVTASQATVLRLGVELTGAKAGTEIQLGNSPPLIAEIRATVRPATLGTVLAHFKSNAKPTILVTRYMSPPLADKLKEMDIPFLDTVGNVYLRTADTFIYVVGRKQKQTGEDGAVRAFREKGLKVIFALLCVPDLIRLPYREIARQSGVALGTITNIIKDLEKLGYLYRSKKKGLVWENRQQLIEQWVNAYPLSLRPKLKRQRFRLIQSDWWKEFDYKLCEKFDLWFGGEVAAALLTKYLHPEYATVYGRPEFKKLAQIIQPVKDEQGNFELLEPFWHFKIEKQEQEQEHIQRLCPPLLIYADLVAAGEARQLDAAEIIRKKYLA